MRSSLDIDLTAGYHKSGLLKLAISAASYESAWDWAQPVPSDGPTDPRLTARPQAATEHHAAFRHISRTLTRLPHL